MDSISRSSKKQQILDYFKVDPDRINDKKAQSLYAIKTTSIFKRALWPFSQKLRHKIRDRAIHNHILSSLNEINSNETSEKAKSIFNQILIKESVLSPAIIKQFQTTHSFFSISMETLSKDGKTVDPTLQQAIAIQIQELTSLFDEQSLMGIIDNCESYIELYKKVDGQSHAVLKNEFLSLLIAMKRLPFGIKKHLDIETDEKLNSWMDPGNNDNVYEHAFNSVLPLDSTLDPDTIPSNYPERAEAILILLNYQEAKNSYPKDIPAQLTHLIQRQPSVTYAQLINYIPNLTNHIKPSLIQPFIMISKVSDSKTEELLINLLFNSKYNKHINNQAKLDKIILDFRDTIQNNPDILEGLEVFNEITSVNTLILILTSYLILESPNDDQSKLKALKLLINEKSGIINTHLPFIKKMETKGTLKEFRKNIVLSHSPIFNYLNFEEDVEDTETSEYLVSKHHELIGQYSNQQIHQILHNLADLPISKKLLVCEHQLINNNYSIENKNNIQDLVNTLDNINMIFFKKEKDLFSLEEIKNHLNLNQLTNKSLLLILESLQIQPDVTEEGQGHLYSINKSFLPRLAIAQSKGQNIIQNTSKIPEHSYLQFELLDTSPSFIRLFSCTPTLFEQSYAFIFKNNTITNLISAADKHIEDHYPQDLKAIFYDTLFLCINAFPSQNPAHNLNLFMNDKYFPKEHLFRKIKEQMHDNKDSLPKQLVIQSIIQPLIHKIKLAYSYTTPIVKVIDTYVTKVSDLLLNELPSFKVNSMQPILYNFYFDPILTKLNQSERAIYYQMITDAIISTSSILFSQNKIEENIGFKKNLIVRFFNDLAIKKTVPTHPSSLNEIASEFNKNLCKYKSVSTNSYDTYLQDARKEAQIQLLLKDYNLNMKPNTIHKIFSIFSTSKEASLNPAKVSKFLEGIEILIGDLIDLPSNLTIDNISDIFIKCEQSDDNFSSHFENFIIHQNKKSYDYNYIVNSINDEISLKINTDLDIQNSPYLTNLIKETYKNLDMNQWHKQDSMSKNEFIYKIYNQIEHFLELSHPGSFFNKQAVLGLIFESINSSKELKIASSDDLLVYISGVIETLNTLSKSKIFHLLIERLLTRLDVDVNNIKSLSSSAFNLFVGLNTGGRSLAHTIHSFFIAKPYERLDPNSIEKINEKIAFLLENTFISPRALSLDFIQEPVKNAIHDELMMIKNILMVKSNKLPQKTADQLTKTEQERMKSFTNIFSKNEKLTKIKLITNPLFNTTANNSFFDDNLKFKDKALNYMKEQAFQAIEIAASSQPGVVNVKIKELLTYITRFVIKNSIRAYIKNQSYWFDPSSEPKLIEQITSIVLPKIHKLHEKNPELVTDLCKNLLQYKSLSEEKIEKTMSIIGSFIGELQDEIFETLCFVDETETNSTYKLFNTLVDQGSELPLLSNIQGLRIASSYIDDDSKAANLPSFFDHLSSYYNLLASPDGEQKLGSYTTKLLLSICTSKDNPNSSLLESVEKCQGLIKEVLNSNALTNPSGTELSSFVDTIQNFPLPFGGIPQPTIKDLFENNKHNQTINSIRMLLNTIHFEKSPQKLETTIDLMKEFAQPILNSNFTSILSKERKTPIYKTTNNPAIRAVLMFQSRGKNFFVAILMNFIRFLISTTNWSKKSLLRTATYKILSNKLLDIVKNQFKEKIRALNEEFLKLEKESSDLSLSIQQCPDCEQEKRELTKELDEVNQKYYAIYKNLEQTKAQLKSLIKYKEDLKPLIESSIKKSLIFFEHKNEHQTTSLKEDILSLFKNIDTYVYKKSKDHTIEEITLQFTNLTDRIYNHFSKLVVSSFYPYDETENTE